MHKKSAGVSDDSATLLFDSSENIYSGAWLNSNISEFMTRFSRVLRNAFPFYLNNDIAHFKTTHLSIHFYKQAVFKFA